MSRDIKFRGWDSVNEVMLPVESINFREGYVSLNEGDNSLTDTLEMIELMQYTGLKDKNGKEIYEGDIVKLIPLNSERLKELGRKWYEHLKVEWGAYSDGEYVTNVETWMIGINPLSEELLDETVEVIGNIYENPELLEGER